MSYTFMLSGHSSILEHTLYPAIENGQSYESGLINFSTLNSILNIDATNNKFYYGNGQVLEIPVGSYELTDLEEYLRSAISLRAGVVKLSKIGRSNRVKKFNNCADVRDWSVTLNV
ncbi:hypothetical protein QAD02_013028 [Eretmocerus hayati]|uniref:Uncharacterized protein n=1 Tax=Eretmocerus hayati TaxID=131215 RepID=A0ACC2P1E8_9HYME|nr:hypothetical protein QAD02_013028 [Eretmocerus hayati]